VLLRKTSSYLPTKPEEEAIVEMARIVKNGRVQRAAKQKPRGATTVAKFFRRFKHPSSGEVSKTRNIWGMQKTLLPAFASTMCWGTDKVPKPIVCPCCRVKPCLMLSHKTEILEQASIFEDRGATPYYLRSNMSDYMLKKMENLLQKPVDSLPQCFQAYLEKWFPGDLETSEEEEELDADEEITTG